MKNQHEKLSGQTFEGDPTERLCRRVMQRVEYREIARARLWTVIYGALSVGGLVGLIPAAEYLGERLLKSGFAQYVSLFASDGSYLLSHWQNTLLSIADTVPAAEATVIVAIVLVCLASFRVFMQYLSALNERQHRILLNAVAEAKS